MAAGIGGAVTSTAVGGSVAGGGEAADGSAAPLPAVVAVAPRVEGAARAAVAVATAQAGRLPSSDFPRCRRGRCRRRRRPHCRPYRQDRCRRPPRQE